MTNVADMLQARRGNRHEDQGDLRHWRTHRDENALLWLYLDKEDSSANTLDAAVLEEFSTILDGVEADRPKAVIIRSKKRAGFCVGADIAQFAEADASELGEALQRGHGILDRLEQLSLPTIAVVHGHCLGGGLELALACDLRIGLKGALEMGFPEIMLGLHPGLGGTFRLTGLINPIKAMTLMLTGKSVHNEKAKRDGLVDAMVEERHLANAVAAAVAGEIRPHRASIIDKLLGSAAVRSLAAGRMRAQAERQAPAKHYPAPSALIDLWVDYGGSRKRMQKAEIKSFAELIDSDTSKNLVRVFFLREGLKRQVSTENRIEHVHIIGAGAMGGDIAAWCALKGLRVTLSDVKKEPIAAANKTLAALCRAKHLSSAECRAAIDRLIADPDQRALSQADLVIEVAPEEAELKEKIYRAIEPQLKQGAILASNTSSLPLSQLASYLEAPERLVGIHFFNPVSKMLIVEVVTHAEVGEQTTEQALAFTAAIGKLPVAVQSYPGFLVNRALTPYLLEAMTLLDEGVDKATIDRCAVEFGMPMGPVELADQVGLDICLHVADVLEKLLDKPMAPIPDWLREKVEGGDLGKKSGQGFYEWKKGKAVKDKATSQVDSDPQMSDRLLLPLLNACVECLREGVVADAEQLDAAIIFGTGFAPFRGGPMHYAKTRGVSDIVEQLNALAEQHGERFLPDAYWKDL